MQKKAPLGEGAVGLAGEASTLPAQNNIHLMREEAGTVVGTQQSAWHASLPAGSYTTYAQNDQLIAAHAVFYRGQTI